MNKDLPFSVFWYHSWRFEMSWDTFAFDYACIKKRRGLFHCGTSTFRKRKLPIPFCSIKSSDDYLNIKAYSWNGWFHSSEQQKTYPGTFCEAFLSLLTLLPWHWKLLTAYGTTFCSTPRQIFATWFDYWYINKLCNVMKQIILNNLEGYVKCKCLVCITVCLYATFEL